MRNAHCLYQKIALTRDDMRHPNQNNHQHFPWQSWFYQFLLRACPMYNGDGSFAKAIWMLEISFIATSRFLQVDNPKYKRFYQFLLRACPMCNDKQGMGAPPKPKQPAVSQLLDWYCVFCICICIFIRRWVNSLITNKKKGSVRTQSFQTDNKNFKLTLNFDAENNHEIS